MKNLNFKLPLVSMVLILSVLMFSCKKKKTAPTITLNGASSIALCLGAEYVEAGASAIDAYGDPVDVTISGAVNTGQVGTYTVEYTSTDKNDNVANEQVTVNVDVCVSSMLADYTVSSDCVISIPLFGDFSLISENQSVIAGPTENEFVIDGFNAVLTQVSGSIDGTTITIPSNTFTVPVAGIDVTIFGSGTINEIGTEMVINYTYSTTLLSGTCTATYTKQ
jgi:hypothetical protein